MSVQKFPELYADLYWTHSMGKNVPKDLVGSRIEVNWKKRVVYAKVLSAEVIETIWSTKLRANIELVDEANY